MRRWRESGWGRHFLCGTLIGAGAILPGVSGGTLAVVFGVYRPLLELCAHPRTAFPRYWRLLLPLGVGWIGGFLLFAWLIVAFMGSSTTAAAWLFIGLIAGTFPALWRAAGARSGHTKGGYVSMTLCFCALLAGLAWTRYGLRFTAAPSPGWYAVCGALWGMGVVLPGFTASPISMALGLYQPMLERMAALDWTVYAASLPAMGLTVLALARWMRWLLRRYHAAAAHGIAGVVAASALSIVPVSYAGMAEAVLSAVCGAGGLLLALRLSKLDRLFEDAQP